MERLDDVGLEFGSMSVASRSIITVIGTRRVARRRSGHRGDAAGRKMISAEIHDAFYVFFFLSYIKFIQIEVSSKFTFEFNITFIKYGLKLKWTRMELKLQSGIFLQFW